jgi:hypothetical protein
LGITKASAYKVKGVPRPGHKEFTYTMEVIKKQELVGKHACPNPPMTYAEVVAETGWLTQMSYNCSRHHDLEDSIHVLYPQRKKDAFKIYRVDPQIPRGAMSHSTSLSPDLCDELLATQREIYYLRT